ncbi:MAG: alpha-ketoglutaric semialdehyde dehydrogenase [Gaiellales bacterium]|nr:alpha-ketoglutaric semialdehyde dehydrogenase [Gaiellales bacterium]
MSAPTLQIESFNPDRPDDVVLRVDPAGGVDVDRAVGRASGAAREFAALPSTVRGDALRLAADALEARVEEVGQLITREVGKPIGEARGEAARGVAILRYYAGLALDPDGESFPSADAKSLLFSRRAPRGVVGLITPWNFPIAIPAWKLGPALVYGNAVVWKPSEHSPACGEVLREILEPLLPEGVLEVVHGAGETGSALVAHGDVAAVSFTGSTVVGREVATRLAERGAASQCEMGGQNASIVLADADMDKAAGMLAFAAMGYAGQKCTATSRIVCERVAYEPLREALHAAISRLVVENPADPACQVGPLITPGARDAAVEAIERARSDGGKVLIGGVPLERDGGYLEPTLIELDDPTAELAQHEVFAPVCALLSAADADDALRIARGVRHGLSAAVYTRDLDRALDLARNLDTGLVRINQPTSGADFHVPFGGEKASGYGPREQGRAARDFYTSTRTVLISPAGP